jgi:hypothetical protein
VTEFASTVGVVVDRHSPASRVIDLEYAVAEVTAVAEGLGPDIHNDLLLDVPADDMRAALGTLVWGTSRG